MELEVAYIVLLFLGLLYYFLLKYHKNTCVVIRSNVTFIKGELKNVYYNKGKQELMQTFRLYTAK